MVDGNPHTKWNLTEELLRRLKEIERRSRWEIALGAAVVFAMAAMMVSFLAGIRDFHLTLSAPAPLFFAALMLLLLTTWLIQERTRKSYVAQFGYLLQEARIREQQEITIRDPLTGLYNRVALEEFAARSLRQAQRSGAPLTLAVFDLDHFHELNRTHGHIAGDVALTQFAHILQGSTRGSDLVARFGGDEFVLLLPETGEAGYQIVVARIHERVESRNTNTGTDGVPISFTSGRAQARPGLDFLELFNEADADLLKNKELRSTSRTSRSSG